MQKRDSTIRRSLFVDCFALLKTLRGWVVHMHDKQKRYLFYELIGKLIIDKDPIRVP